MAAAIWMNGVLTWKRIRHEIDSTRIPNNSMKRNEHKEIYSKQQILSNFTWLQFDNVKQQ